MAKKKKKCLASCTKRDNDGKDTASDAGVTKAGVIEILAISMSPISNQLNHSFRGTCFNANCFVILRLARYTDSPILLT